MHDVQEGLEEAFDRPSSWVDAHGYAAEYARDDETVTRLAHVYELVVRAQGDRVRGLPVWNRIGRLLQPDDLTVCKLAAVVD